MNLRLNYSCVGRDDSLVAKGQTQTDNPSAWSPIVGTNHSSILLSQTDDMSEEVIKSLDSASVWTRIDVG